MIRAGGRRVEAQHLAEPIRRSGEPGRPDTQRYRPQTPEDERAAIVAALEQAGGSRSEAAEILGMSRTTLWRRMKDFAIEPDDV